MSKLDWTFKHQKVELVFVNFTKFDTECCYCLAVCMCVCVRTHVCVRACACVYACVSAYVCMFVCIIYNNRTFWMFAIQKSLLVLKFHVIWLLYLTMNRIFVNYCPVLSIIFWCFTVIHFNANTSIERRVVTRYAWKYLECQEFDDCLCFIF